MACRMMDCLASGRGRTGEYDALQGAEKHELRGRWVTLRDFEAELTALDSGELLKIAVIGFNCPGILSSRLRLQVGHEQVGSCEVVRRCRLCQRSETL